MNWVWTLRAKTKSARKRGAGWVRLLDILRLMPSAEGRARLWTRFRHGDRVHQTSPDTFEERYPALFDLAARLAPGAQRLLSYGCSTGEELVSLRRRFPCAEIVGAEINPRSRRIAVRRVAGDARIRVVRPAAINGSFDLVFAMAVLQREPHKIDEMAVENLQPYYPFARFDSAVRELVDCLRPGGLLCVDHAQYRVEDSSAAAELEPVEGAPLIAPGLFGPDGRRLDGTITPTLFRKVGDARQ